jgi:anti-sigma B factor antagonist
MELSEEMHDHYAVVAVTGRLDTTNYTLLEKKLGDLVDNGVIKVVLECSRLDYVSSTGLRILLVMLKRITGVHGRFMLSGLQEGIREIFEISGFTRIFEIYPSKEEAVKSLSKPS